MRVSGLDCTIVVVGNTDACQHHSTCYVNIAINRSLHYRLVSKKPILQLYIAL
jgi:hypothetical protein